MRTSVHHQSQDVMEHVGSTSTEVKEQYSAAVEAGLLASNPSTSSQPSPELGLAKRTIRRIVTSLRALIRHRYLDIERPCWVKPGGIEYVHLRQGIERFWNIDYDRGLVRGGDWDRDLRKFDDSDIAQAVRLRFTEGVPWTETAFYQRVLEDLSQGRSKWGCVTVDDFLRRCSRLDQLYEDIRQNGYKSQLELRKGRPTTAPLYDEVTVVIDRQGRFVFGDGQHRVAIAKICQVDKILVVVARRHAQWYQFRKEIVREAARHGGTIREPLTHPDLSDIPSQLDGSVVELIKNELQGRRASTEFPKTLIQIGAGWGYACHRFEELGFQCHATEENSKDVYFLEKLKKAEERQFEIVPHLVPNSDDTRRFDVVIALDVWHRLLAAKDSLVRMQNFLERTKPQVLFLQHNDQDDQNATSGSHRWTAEEIVHRIVKSSPLNHWTVVGKTSDGRPLYKLSR